MAEITRSSILTGMQDTLGLQPGADNVPKNLAPSIAPVYEVNPRFASVVKAANSSTTGTSAIYTTPSDKDFYLTYLQLGYNKDAANDCTSISVQVRIGGVYITILRFAPVASTAKNETIVIALPYPLKIDRGFAINLLGDFSAGTLTKFAALMGFIVE